MDFTQGAKGMRGRKASEIAPGVATPPASPLFPDFLMIFRVEACEKSVGAAFQGTDALVPPKEIALPRSPRRFSIRANLQFNDPL